MWVSAFPRSHAASSWLLGRGPSLIPYKAGDRVTTNRRDALHLARLPRSGARTPVSGPPVADEAIRDLSRARADALRDLTTAKPRRTAVLLRHDIRSTGRATWGPAHRRWRRAVVCRTPAQQMVFAVFIRAYGSSNGQAPAPQGSQ